MLITHQSMPQLTEFAPQWNINMWNCHWQDTHSVLALRDLILAEESVIVAEFQQRSHHDGGTGLGSHSLTAQYRFYNLFERYADNPVVTALRQQIYREYLNFCSALNYAARDCVIMGWANVLRPGQTMRAHNHGAYPFSYLSGNLHLGNYDTHTVYNNPWDAAVKWPLSNSTGSMTLFPSAVTHWTTEYQGTEPRVSVAWDIMDQALLPLSPAIENYTRVELC